MTGRRKALWVVLIFLTAVIVAVYAALPVVVGKLLTGPKLRALINVRPQEFSIDWEQASSPRLGHLTLRNLTLRGGDPNVQWFARLEHADLEYSVLALLRRTFQCHDLRGSGLSFALRGKLRPGATAADAARLPPIPGFSDPPLKSPDDHFFVDPNAWVVDLRHVAIDRFESIWVNGFHYVGKARVQGGVFLRPLQEVRIDAAALALDGGDLRLAKDSGGISLSGTVRLASEPFAPLCRPPSDVLKKFSADVKLEVRAEKLQALAPFLSPPEGVRIDGGELTAAVETALRGAVANGKVSLAVRDAVVRIPKYRLKGNASVEAPVRRWNVLSGPLDISGSRVSLTDVYSSGADSDAMRGWWGRVEIPSGRIGRTVFARIGVECRDARPLLALLDVKLPGWASGLVKLDDFSATGAVAAAPATLRLTDLDATGGTFHVQGQLTQDGTEERGAFLIQSGILLLGIEVDPARPAKVRLLFAKQWYEKQQKLRATGGK